MSTAPDDSARAELERRLAELTSDYEVARALLGATEPRVIAARLLYSGLGVLGARSGALLCAEARDRFRTLYATSPDVEVGSALRVPEAAREWMRTQAIFVLDGAGTRALGDLGERLVQDFDAAAGAAVCDASALVAILLFGPRMFGETYGEEQRRRIEALAGLATLALRLPVGRLERGTESDPAPRSLDRLREAHPPLRSMVGHSAAMVETAQDLVAAAPTRFPVLITGESGAGKEVAARALHGLSERAAGPFEVVDCGSIPRELIESELFGHVRGAFTGAHRDRRGTFELAHRGTLFLDEIGDMPLQLQTRLLRVLQEGRIRRVGDEAAIEVDVRVVAATHRDLRAAVLEKRFREDLFYRLNVFAIRVPPLRERFEDLRTLMLHFLKSQGRQRGDWTIDREVIAALECHAFPGNLRELVNLCATLTVHGGESGHVRLEDLEAVWRRQHPGEARPWQRTEQAGSGARRLGAWVLEQSRAARFNLIAAARELQRRRRRGQSPPVSERSALAYHLTGEILRALIEADGDEDAAARSIAREPALVPRVAPRVRRVCQALRSAGGDAGALKRAFGKLPAEYVPLIEPAARSVAER